MDNRRRKRRKTTFLLKKILVNLEWLRVIIHSLASVNTCDRPRVFLRKMIRMKIHLLSLILNRLLSLTQSPTSNTEVTSTRSRWWSLRRWATNPTLNNKKMLKQRETRKAGILLQRSKISCKRLEKNMKPLFSRIKKRSMRGCNQSIVLLSPLS